MYHDGEAIRNCTVLSIVFAAQVNGRIGSLVTKIADLYRIDTKPEFFALGSFNRCYKVNNTKELPVLFRFPILGKSAFRYEKTNDECAIIAYVSRHTSIPIPRVISVDHCDLGPFTVTPFVQGALLSTLLQAPSAPGKAAILDPNINISTLTKAYREMARVLIELSSCRFTQIGGLTRDKSKNWYVNKRPVTINMNQLVALGNYPPNALFKCAYSTANEYFAALAEIHLTHLRTQRNDAVDDETDCRKKYIARCLFRNIARNFSTVHNNGPFPLYCDDLRPSNVIVDPDDLTIRSVIDWEYCYAAPVEMTYCSPWWLLLAHVESWRDDLNLFIEQYRPRHELFIQVLRDVEDGMIYEGTLSESRRLSDGMAQSLSNGHFWFCLAATSSFDFDDIYWQFIDQTYYGQFTSIEDRFALLNQQEQEALEPLVSLKIQQQAEGPKLDNHRTDYEMVTA